MVELTINGKHTTVPEGMTILEAARSVGISIPSLCYLKGVHSQGACRICVVEVEGAKNLQPSCIVKVRDGMVVHTNTRRVRDARKLLYDLLVSDHPKECLTCSRSHDCQLQAMGGTLGIKETNFSGEHSPARLDISYSVTRDSRKCILCRRCVTMCNDIQKVGAISPQNRGFETIISPALGLPLNSVNCSMCGQCVTVCPTGALVETDGTEKVWNALNDPSKRVVVQVAPAVRAALGEEFGLPTGTLVTGKIATALHDMGFDDVFDTNFAADLTILEEGTELLQRLDKALSGGGAVLPMITSCSPGWIKHIEHSFPAELAHLSTCKSPHTMLGALVKSYYAKKIGVDPKDIVVVSVMPCTAKKFEIEREEMKNNGYRNVDVVLTTRELARMLKTAGIDFANLSDGRFDDPLGLSTGAADIFGVTGGVMEAALRTTYELVTGKEIPFKGLHVTPIVGFEQVRTAEITITGAKPEYAHLEGVTLKVAVTSGLAGADILMKEVQEGTSPYHFIEVMGCPGGCINGGGQPRNEEPGYIFKRANAIYKEDEGKTLRKSHENPSVKALYDEFLGTPCGEVSHHLLHTHYVPRGLYNELLEKK